LKAAEVKLWGTRIGVIAKNGDTPFYSFRYDPRFVPSKIEVSPVHLPLADQTYTFTNLALSSFYGLPGLLADMLPDRFGQTLIESWLLANGKKMTDFDSIDRLCYLGTRGMGALEFFPDRNQEMNQSETIAVDQLTDLAHAILMQKKAIQMPLKTHEDIIKVGTSAGGARAKAIVAFDVKKGIIQSGQIDAGKDFTYWIMKFDGDDQGNPADYTRLEYAYYLMAKAAKIDMMPSRLWQTDRYTHFMTQRFDRIRLANGKLDKVHMHTLGGLLHMNFNQPGLLSYEEASATMRQIGLKRLDIEQFYRRMVFNVITRNCDDHVKNTSFLMNRQGEWSLSPAYDITYAYNPLGAWTASHQMRINGKLSEITKKDLLTTAESMMIKEDKALGIIQEVKDAIQSWPEFAKLAGLNLKTISLVKEQLIRL
jgi:serine/threonine-protein kinase HipA